MAASVLAVVALCLTATVQGFHIPGLNGSSVDNDVPEAIVGGHQVQIKDYPHQLYMNTTVGACGAAIIGPSWALTAAHCCVIFGTNRPQGPGRITLRTGSANRLANGTVHNVELVKVHEGYEVAGQLSNDICLLKVSIPFEYTSETRAIELPSSNSSELYRPESMTHTSGWGSTVLRGRGNDDLMAVEIPLTSNENCQEALRSRSVDYDITENQFCALSTDKTPCHGDSGGALVSDGQLLGVVSWGVACRDLSVYTKTSAYREWIRTHSGI